MIFERSRTIWSGFLCLMITVASTGQILNENWKPIQRRQSVTYHGNIFQQQANDDRFGKINQLGPFESSLINHYPKEFAHSAPEALVPTPEDGCALYKVGFNQDSQNQYVEYEVRIPDLKELTLCMWTKFDNHSSDHPLFSYSVGDQPKAFASWISNSDKASYYSLSVAGHTFYRLNYPLKPNKWYHSCQSWNGRTGEWQIWVNAERVGRGFYNRLVGHVIKGGGTAITGQEIRQQEKYQPNINSKGTGGMMGEFTMLQLYHVALTAGKAHKDHKHHHVHHFAHDGSPLSLTTANPLPPPTAPAPPNSLLVGGQLTPMLELNLGGGPQLVPAQLPSGLQINQQYVNGQFGPGRAVSEQLFNSNQLRPYSDLGASSGTRLLLTGQLSNPANVQFYETSYTRHNLFKRNQDEVKRSKRDNPEKELLQSEVSETKRQSKRGLIALSDGTVVDDSLLSGETYEQSLLSGLAGLGENIPVQNIQKEKVDEREPAEAEVKAVMELCNGCAEEPFQKALVLSWRHTPKKLHGGSYYYHAVPACKAF